jgi:hypothetical protein
MFLNDMRLVFDNCLAYNRNGSELYDWANSLKESLEGLYIEWINSDLHPHYSSQPPKAERLALKALNPKGTGSPEFKQGNGKWSYTPAESKISIAQSLADAEAAKVLAIAKKVAMDAAATALSVPVALSVVPLKHGQNRPIEEVERLLKVCYI